MKAGVVFVKKGPHLIHGADYNPEQWLDYEGIIDEDFHLLQAAHMNAVTVGIFSWSRLEPQEGIFDFEWLDDIFRRVNDLGAGIVLATPSGARPQWLARTYPEVLRVNERRERELFGKRHNHCFTSPLYRKKVKQIDRMLAKRYAGNPALLVWHLSNEYGGECHCPLCQQAFREWLKEKYHRDLDELNRQYWSAFWSHTYTDWSQIESPSPLGETSIHGLNLDWKRFVTCQTIDFMKMERDAVKEFTPEIPVTTNLMGAYSGLDYHKLAKELDIVSWDSYPMWGSPNDIDVAVGEGLRHDLMRSIGGGKPFMLMECTPSLVNWREVNKLKRPGQHRMASLQAVAHGSDSVQYFQFRKSRGSVEKFHGAVVDHCGHADTRVFREVAEVGAILEKLAEVEGSVVKADSAILFDWENWWALNDVQGLKRFGGDDDKAYLKTVIEHYRCFWKNGISVDIINPEDDFFKYRTIVAPMQYMLTEEAGQRLAVFVKDGGNLVTTYFSGVANENDLVYLGGLPGAGLGEVCGIWAEEIDVLWSGQSNQVRCFGREFDAIDYCEIIHVNTAKAEILGRYASDFYAGMPALTKNNYGKGFAYYIAFRGKADFLDTFYDYFFSAHKTARNISAVLPDGVTVSKRFGKDYEYLFLQNFTDQEKRVKLDSRSFIDLLAGGTVEGVTALAGYEVKVLKTPKQNS